MKIFIITSAVMALLLSCNKESSPKFPECVGITADFDPHNITVTYSGKIWSEDTTIFTPFIFTNYVDYNYILSAERSWYMWIKFTTDSSTIYQSFYCYYSYGDYNFYASGGTEYWGQYLTNWEFKFETFDCSKLSGLCLVCPSESPDTLKYRFEGTR